MNKMINQYNKNIVYKIFYNKELMIIINIFKRHINWIINKINVLWIKETYYLILWFLLMKL